MRSVLILGVLLLGACEREKSFDERYADAAKAIRSSAAEIDTELAARASEAAAATPSDPASPPAGQAGHSPLP
jgi:hypothetical protein